jgi:hypothetical protein
VRVFETKTKNRFFVCGEKKLQKSVEKVETSHLKAMWHKETKNARVVPAFFGMGMGE